MSPLQKIFICGFMGSGKTTHGKKLAAALKLNFIDLDKYIEKKEGKSVQAIFSERGEEIFRAIETSCLKEITLKKEPSIISLGGGTICFNNNIEKVLDEGLLIYIKMSPEALFKRLINSKQQRPLLQNKTPDEILEFIKTTLAYREQFYSRAHITVQGIDLDLSALIEEILSFKSTR